MFVFVVPIFCSLFFFGCTSTEAAQQNRDTKALDGFEISLNEYFGTYSSAPKLQVNVKNNTEKTYRDVLFNVDLTNKTGQSVITVDMGVYNQIKPGDSVSYYLEKTENTDTIEGGHVTGCKENYFDRF